jgi:hypothetical protein
MWSGSKNAFNNVAVPEAGAPMTFAISELRTPKSPISHAQRKQLTLD